MLNRIFQLFTPPVFEDKEKTFLARVTFNVILAAYVVLLVGLFVAYLTTDQDSGLIKYGLLIGGILINTGSLILVKRGRVNEANLVLLAMNTIIVYAIAFTSGGLERPAIFLNVFILALSAILLRGRGLLITGIVLSLGIGVIYWLEGAFPDPNLNVAAPRENVAIMNIFIIVLTGFLLQISNRFLDSTLQRAQESEQKLQEANTELESVGKNLQGLVAERTASLEHNLQQLEKHTAQLQAITDISQNIVSIQDLDQLLPLIVNSVTERFGYYHAAIYLKDETGNHVIIKAASSEGGQRLLQNQHKLRVEPSSLIGFAASRGQSRVTSNVERDATYMAIPELPDTKSEAVLPLRVGTRVIGVLDVQSTQPNAFSEREVNILNTLANQVAISVQNELLFSETRQALVESEKIYQQYVLLNWKQITKKTPLLGYQYLPEGETTPLNTPIEIPETASGASDVERTLVKREDQTALYIPIRLRGQTIGAMSIQTTESREWDQDEMAVIQATAERVALALENARLLEDSQRRATKERVISDIAAKITGSISMDKILKTAVEELGQAIPSADVVIQFQNPEAG